MFKLFIFLTEQSLCGIETIQSLGHGWFQHQNTAVRDPKLRKPFSIPLNVRSLSIYLFAQTLISFGPYLMFFDFRFSISPFCCRYSSPSPTSTRWSFVFCRVSSAPNRVEFLQDDMGLGKTVQVAVFLCVSKSLVWSSTSGRSQFYYVQLDK